MSSSPLRAISASEIASSKYLSVNGLVYDVSKFKLIHPGGRHVLEQELGSADSSSVFARFHAPDLLQQDRFKKLVVGTSPSYVPPFVPLPPTSDSAKLFPSPTCVANTNTSTHAPYIPFTDPLSVERFPDASPFYNQSHHAWRAYVKSVIYKLILAPNALFPLAQWQDGDRPPAKLVEALGSAGLLAACTGSGPSSSTKSKTKAAWAFEALDEDVKQKLKSVPGVPSPASFDRFHELIVWDEFGRLGRASAVGALSNGPAIALSALLQFGLTTQEKEEEEQGRKKAATVVNDVVMGREFIALAISEPQTGSDVASLNCFAVQDEKDDKYYKVTGNKKWITNGTYARYFVVGVRTPESQALSLMLIDRKETQFNVRKVGGMRDLVSGTAYLDFDGARVPKSNLIGSEGAGFKLIMLNFNHERWMIASVVTRMSRVVLSECVKYALNRVAFGKPLANMQSIRLKVSSMARRIELLQSLLETVTFYMTKPSTGALLGDVTGLLKEECSRTYTFCCDEATHIFGGNSLSEAGPGKFIEHHLLQTKGYEIPAGARDTMADFVGRSIFRNSRL